MSHHTKLASGNYVNHNGGWDGDLQFGSPPTVADLKEVLLTVIGAEIIGDLEMERRDNVSNLALLLDHLDEWTPPGTWRCSCETPHGYDVEICPDCGGRQ